MARYTLQSHPAVYAMRTQKKREKKDRKEKGKLLHTCVDPLVCLEVRALGVDFGAAWEITVVDATLLQFGIVAPVVFDCICFCYSIREPAVLRFPSAESRQYINDEAERIRKTGDERS